MKKQNYLMLIFVTTTIFMISKCQATVDSMDMTYAWRYLDYVFPNNDRESYIQSGQYIPENIIPLDVTVWQGQNQPMRFFISTPRVRAGIPASFSSVSTTTLNGSYLLQPYPDWSWHTPNDCRGIISVFRATIDTCNRLWILDTGYLHTQGRVVCPPQILIFDLRNDKIVHRYQFPTSQTDIRSQFIAISLDIRDRICNDVVAYIADTNAYHLLVYDHMSQRSWRVNHNLFYPFPLYGTTTIGDISFDLMDGIFSFGLSPFDNDGDRTLYFHSFASNRESWVKVSILRNESLFENGENLARDQFFVSSGTRSSQSGSQVMTEDTGIMFFGLMSANALACWNSQLDYDQPNIGVVAQDNDDLQFVSGLKDYNRRIWVITSRFHRFISGQMDFTDTNYRVMSSPTDQLIADTPCVPRRSNQRPNRPNRPNAGGGGGYVPSSGGYPPTRTLEPGSNA